MNCRPPAGRRLVPVMGGLRGGLGARGRSWGRSERASPQRRHVLGSQPDSSDVSSGCRHRHRTYRRVTQVPHTFAWKSWRFRRAPSALARRGTSPSMYRRPASTLFSSETPRRDSTTPARNPIALRAVGAAAACAHKRPAGGRPGGRSFLSPGKWPAFAILKPSPSQQGSYSNRLWNRSSDEQRPSGSSPATI